MNELAVKFGEYVYIFSPEKNAWYCEQDEDILSTDDITEAIRGDANELNRRVKCNAQ